jgi:NADPH:quinone reductase
MTTEAPRTALQLRSLVKKSGELELSLVEVAVAAPSPNEVLVRIEASPINPSDLGLLLAAADPSTAVFSGTAERPVVTARIPDGAMAGLAARVDASMAVGNEGAGRVIAAGSSAAAQALLGKTVALLGGSMYSQVRGVQVEQCLVLPEDVSAAEGASAFVNPLTALGMVATLRREGHTALVHTAAASSLGQMLVKLCKEEHVALVNVVRSDAQVEILRALGAEHVCNSSAPTFAADLVEAIAATGATLAFDATGGGPLPGQLLSSMEAALARNAKEYSRYGSTTHKQVYLYGGLDTRPTELKRNYGMAWGLGGWLVSNFLAKLPPAETQALRGRVATGLKTTFATKYAKQVSLAEALQPEAFAAYAKRATGEKYLIDPNKHG